MADHGSTPPPTPDHGRDFWRAPAISARLAPSDGRDTLTEATFRVLADNLPTLCWLANGDGYIVWYNRRWHDYCGTTPEQMEGWGWTTVHDPDHLPRVMARWTASIATGEPFEMTFPLRGADGLFRPFLTRVSPVRDARGEVVRWCGVNTDVSEQVAADAALRAERDRAQGVLDGMDEAFLLLDHALVICDINAKALSYEDRPRDAFVGRRLGEAWPGAEEGPHGSLYRRVLADKLPRSLATFYEWSDGRSGWFEINAHPVAEGVAVFYRDVTEQKAANDAMRRTNERTAALAAEREAILGQLAEGVIVTDTSGAITFVNEAAERLHGVKLIGVPPDDYARAYSLLTEERAPYPARELPLARAVLDGETVVDARWRIRRADGSEALAIGSARPIRGAAGAQTGAVLTVRDDTERMRAELALRETAERYRLVARATNDAIWDWSFATGRVLWNEALTASYGHAPDGSETDPGWWLDHIHPDDRERVDRDIHRVIEGAEQQWTDEYRFRRADGSYLHVLDRGTVIRGEDGRAVRMIGAMFDLTDRRRAEAALRELNETLERRVAEAMAERSLEQARLAEIEAALRQSQKMEAVGQLTGGIAHDFNNLLTIVLGNLDLGRRLLGGGGDQQRIERVLGNAQRGAERAASLTQRLLAFSRRQPLVPKPTDVARLLTGMSDLLARALGETIRLELRPDADLPRVEVDPNQLESALLNLGVNARDAMPDGGQLTVSVSARQVLSDGDAPAVVTAGDYVVITVADTGAGMPDDVAARAFEPFFTTKDVGRGTGLGLSMVYGFTRQSKGHVTIDTAEGRGTSVVLWLPALRDHAAIVPEPPAAEAPIASGAGRTVLVVEDDPDVRAYTVGLVGELGYAVLEAADGAAALGLIDRPIDLLLTDVVMPVMSGPALAEAARARRPDLRILFTSGYTRDALVHDGRLDEGVDLLLKPFTLDTLARRLQAALASAA